MTRPSSSASWAARTAIVLTAALCAFFAAKATPAFADLLPISPPATSVQTPAGGATVGSGGVDVTAGSGATEVGLGVGSGGVTVRLPGSADTGSSPGTGSSPSTPGKSSPTPAIGNPGGKAPAGDGRAPSGGSSSGRDGTTAHDARGDSPSEPAAADRSGLVQAERVAARTKNTEDQSSSGGGVVKEFIERIPPTVRAGLVALGMIALALWILWVRARRELERNAYVDPASGVSNAPAFVPVLAREITRAERYGRPFGLVMLEVERRGGVGWKPRLTPRAVRRATATISDRVRDADTVVQLDRDRFAVLCPEATPASIETLGRSLELRFEEERVHVKVGTAALRPDGDSPEDLAARALALATGEEDWQPSAPMPAALAPSSRVAA